ncbi:MAG: hypothetical protein AAGF79_17920, partial [Pseudomonadota bacterium]
MSIQSFLSDLLTFDYSVESGPISDSFGIDWSYSISSDLDFTGKSGVSYAQQSSFSTSSVARDYSAEDEFMWDLQGPQSPGGISYSTEGDGSVQYDSFRGTSVDNASSGALDIDVANVSLAGNIDVEVDTEILGADYFPAFRITDTFL